MFIPMWVVYVAALIIVCGFFNESKLKKEITALKAEVKDARENNDISAQVEIDHLNRLVELASDSADTAYDRGFDKGCELGKLVGYDKYKRDLDLDIVDELTEKEQAQVNWYHFELEYELNKLDAGMKK